MALQKVGVVLTAEQAEKFFKLISQSNKAVEDFGKVVQVASSKLSGLKDAAKIAGKIDELTGKLNLQQRQLGILTQEYEHLVKKYGESSVQAQKKKLALDKLTGSVEQTKTKIQGYEHALGELGKETDETRKKSGLLATLLGKSLPVAIGNLISTGIKKLASSLVELGIKGVGLAASFQDSMNMFRVQSQASNEEMQKFSATAKALGADLTLPNTSATDAAEAMLELSKAGLSVNDTMAAAKGVLQLSAAGNLSNAEAAEIASNALNAFHLEGTQATKVANLLAGAANASSLEVVDVAAGFKMASAIFNAFQSPVVGAENAMIDLTTSLAVLANAGVKGSDAGTALKQSLLQLTAPSKIAKGMMKELAVRIGLTGDIAYDSTGTMRSYEDIIKNVAKATADMTQEQRDNYVSQIFGADASRAVLILMDSMSKKAVETGHSFDDMREAVTRQNAAADLANARMQGLNGAIQGLVSQGETLLVDLFEPWLPLMENVVRGAGFLVEKLQFLGPVMQDLAGATQTIIDGFDQLVPFIAAATGVLIFHTAVMEGQAIVASIKMAAVKLKETLAVKLNTEALATNVAASLKAALAYAAVAVAVLVVIQKYQEYKQKISDATDALLESSPKWGAATKALEKYGEKSDYVQDALKGQKKRLDDLQATQKADLARLGEIGTKMEGLGQGSRVRKLLQQEYDDLHGVVNQRFADIDRETKLFEENMAVTEASEQRVNAYAGAVKLAAEKQQLVNQGLADAESAFRYSAEQINEAHEAIEKIAQAGPSALKELGQGQVDFKKDMEKLEKDHTERLEELYEERRKATSAEQRVAIDKQIAEEKQGFDDQFKVAAMSYAQQRAAQRAHLGQMLIDYVNAQAIVNKEFREKAGELNTAIAAEYGVQADASQILFGDMLNHVDGYTTGSITSLDEMIGKMRDTEAEMAVAQQKTSDLADVHVNELIQAYRDEKITADELARALGNMPAQVTTEVVINYTERNRPQPINVVPIDVVPGRVAPGQRAAVIPQEDLTPEPAARDTSPTPATPRATPTGRQVARQHGGPFRRFQPTLVGEHGPELLIPRISGFVMNNNILRSFASSAKNITQSTKRLQLGHANTFGNQNAGGLFEASRVDMPASRRVSQPSIQRGGGATIVYSPTIQVDATQTGADPHMIADLAVEKSFSALNGLLDRAILKG